MLLIAVFIHFLLLAYLHNLLSIRTCIERHYWLFDIQHFLKDTRYLIVRISLDQLQPCFLFHYQFSNYLPHEYFSVLLSLQKLNLIILTDMVLHLKRFSVFDAFSPFLEQHISGSIDKF